MQAPFQFTLEYMQAPFTLELKKGSFQFTLDKIKEMTSLVYTSNKSDN